MATGLSKLFSFSVLLVPFLRRRTLLELGLKLFTPQKALVLSVGRIGVPTFLRMSMLTLSSIVINNVAAQENGVNLLVDGSLDDPVPHSSR